ncbi:hypothetical protein JL09_g5919 [Pichia kudriavzevii]|uniref:Uncharacterized protein n=1 Tax=Pichia kudriavzevii TaxID=4909 RepID=A0A099NSQ8_PICKU|nr:hypothetical protein JL09_g5919 [Pichia kudriavzevii]
MPVAYFGGKTAF